KWTPYMFKQLDLGSSRFLYYLNYVRYRIGFQYAMLPYISDAGMQYKETKLTFGLGFPLPERPINTIRGETIGSPRIVDAMSFLNLGVELGQIEASEGTHVPEQNVNLKQRYIAL